MELLLRACRGSTRTNEKEKKQTQGSVSFAVRETSNVLTTSDVGHRRRRRTSTETQLSHLSLFSLHRPTHPHRRTDDVNAIVIDIGSSTVKAGYAGEDAPKAVYPSVRERGYVDFCLPKSFFSILAFLPRSRKLEASRTPQTPF